MVASLLGFMPSFIRGSRLVDGGDCLTLFNSALGPTSGITALAGGGLTGAPVLPLGWVEVDTVATTSDSVLLPPALPGDMIWVNNNGANTLDIYSNQFNFSNPSATVAYQADVVVPPGTVTANSATTALTLTSGYVTLFFCFKLGTWKQMLTAHA